MKKRFLSLFLAISFATSLMFNLMSVASTASAETVVKDVSAYGSWVWSTAYWVPGSSGSANYVTWSATGSQAETGTHVQTAELKSGASSVPAGEIAIGLGGSLGNIKLADSDGKGARTFHTRFTFNSSTTPILYRIQYRNASNKDARKGVFTMSNGGVTYGDKTISVTAPYDINIFQNTDSGVTVIYVNDQILLDQRETAENLWASGATYWHQTQFVTTEADSAFKLVIQNAHHDIYEEEVLLSDVIDYVMHKSQAKNTNYWWSIDGIKTGWKEIQGAMDGLCSITGDNTNGYVLKPNSSNAPNYGFARYFLGSDDKEPLDEYIDYQNAVLHQSFEYQPTKLISGQMYRIRGGTSSDSGYQTLITAVPATDTEAAYLNIGGTKVYMEDETAFYKIDFIVDIASAAETPYEFYILVNGKIIYNNAIWNSRQPLWQTVFTSNTTDESMTLRNIKTTMYKEDVILEDVVDAARVKIKIPFETNADGYGDFEVENYKDCYDAAAWKISESRRLYSNSKALSVIAENKTAPADDEEPTLNLSFKANRSDTSTYYLWIRHTASVANQSGQNFYLSKTEYGSYTTFTLSAEPKAPQWICLGSVTVNSGENGYVRIRHRQQNHIAVDRYVITADPTFIPTDAHYVISPATSSTAYSIPSSSFSNGRVSFEAEKTTYSSPYDNYSITSHYSTYGLSSNFSGSDGIITSSSDSKTFSETWSTNPHIEFNFTSATSGSKYLWARMYSTSTNKNFAISVNCSEYNQVSPTTENKWYWQLISVIDGVQANLPVNVRLYNVTGGYAFDTFAISDSVFDTPSGKNVSWTTKSTTLTSPYSAPTVSASTVKAMSHPRIYFTANEVNTVRAALSNTENSAALTKHNANVARGKKSNFTGSLAVVPGYSNNNSEFLGVIESLAFEYAINADSEAGNKAVSSAMNYIGTVSYAGIESDVLTRTAGNDIAVLSRIYDWCYDLLTADQKNSIIAKCQEIAYQLEIGWPPENLSSVTGFGAEGALQNYLLTMAIAVADERPDVYNYVVGRIQDEFIPERKRLYASGESLQGTRYGTYRGQHDLTAALLLSTIGYGANVYGEGLEDLVNWYIYARRPDGLLFVDGDDTNNGKTAGEYYTVGHMQNAFVIAARLFNNPYIKNEAKEATKNFTTFGYGEGYISPASFLAINRPSLTSVKENGYPLTKYFGSPNGNMIARTGWSSSPSVTDTAAVAFMKTGQVNISNHQHLDAGNFQLYYKGILANDPSYYTGSNYSSEYMNIYAKRSVAHNTVLVRDGVSRTLNGHSAADGGQVLVSAPTGVDSITAVAKTEAYDFGGDDINQPDYSYLKSDLTGAYSSNSVSDYNRSFMFLNMYDNDTPAALVVFDRLKTVNAKHNTAWLLHGLNAPSISGNRSTFTLDANGYTGKMTNDTLLPSKSTITSVKDGYLTAGGTNYNSGYSSGSGVCESEGYRIEVSPSSQSTTTYYLNVIQVGEANSTAAAPALIENDTFIGASLKDRIVLFSKSGDLIGSEKSVEYSFNFTESEGYLCKIAVADVAEGSWEIFYSEDGTNYTLTQYAKTHRIGPDDKGATIYFKGRAGYYKLVRKSNTHEIIGTQICTENQIKQLSPGVKLKNNILYVAPRSYESIGNAGGNEYNYKQIIAVYDKGDKRLIATKIYDINQTDKNSGYEEFTNFIQANSDAIVIKTFIFENLENVSPVAAAKSVTFK